MVGLLSVSCNGQKNETKKAETEEREGNVVEQPKGSWKVD